MSGESLRAILPEPPPDLKTLSETLQRRLVDEIRSSGPMPFARYMEICLYEPGLGYYSAGLRKFGADGDFVTAPELGTVFAQCLARQVGQLADRWGDYEILELGAGTGALAADLLTALSPDQRPSHYRILERSAELKQRQQQHLARTGLSDTLRFSWVNEPPREGWTGILLANEVVDALPVERFRVTGETVQRQCIIETANGLGWSDEPAPDALTQAVRHVTRRGGLTNGYRSELCTSLPAWLAGLIDHLDSGCALFIDYGYPRETYYHPERRDGTLVCHYRHRAHDDPLLWPGLQDISAFVDFTALAEAAHDCGMDVAGYTNQAMFLIDCGLDAVLQGMADLPDRERMALAQQVRELTLPGAMGEKFQVMALTRDLDQALLGFRSLDLRSRL